MARMFKNVTTGVMVTPSNERVAAMYADHPSWEEVKKGKKAAKENTAPDPGKAPDPGTGSDSKNKEE